MGPRDGLQNEKQTVPLATKLELIDRLAAAGLREIEATSFVSPEVGAADGRPRRVDARAAAPPRACATGADAEPAGLRSGDGRGCRPRGGVRRGVEKLLAQRTSTARSPRSIERFLPVMAAARAAAQGACAMSCAHRLPLRRRHRAAAGGEVCERLMRHRLPEVSLGDTIGVGTPASVQRMLERWPRRAVGAAGRPLSTTPTAWRWPTCMPPTVRAALLRRSVAGLGGCPYAKGATGNVATEDVVYLLHGLGATPASTWTPGGHGRNGSAPSSAAPPASRVGRALIAKRAEGGSA